MKAKKVSENLNKFLPAKPYDEIKEIIKEKFPTFLNIYNELFPDNPGQYDVENVSGDPKAYVAFSHNGVYFMLSVWGPSDRAPLISHISKNVYTSDSGKKISSFIDTKAVRSAKEVMNYVDLHASE